MRLITKHMISGYQHFLSTHSSAFNPQSSPILNMESNSTRPSPCSLRPTASRSPPWSCWLAPSTATSNCSATRSSSSAAAAPAGWIATHSWKCAAPIPLPAQDHSGGEPPQLSRGTRPAALRGCRRNGGVPGPGPEADLQGGNHPALRADIGPHLQKLTELANPRVLHLQ